MSAKRTPEQIIGHDALTQLTFEGYAVVAPAPSPEAGVLVDRLRIKADMLRMGEPIAYGSDAVVLEEAASLIQSLSARLEAVERERDEKLYRAESNRDDWRERARSADATIAKMREALDGVLAAIKIAQGAGSTAADIRIIAAVNVAAQALSETASD